MLMAVHISLILIYINQPIVFIYFYYSRMYNPQSKELSFQLFSKFGKKLLQTHQGLKQVAKRIDAAERKVTYNPNRQPRPPCYHPGAAKKQTPVRKSSSFLSTARGTSTKFSVSQNKIKSEFKYQPNFEQVKCESPSWTFNKASKNCQCQFRKSKVSFKDYLQLKNLEKQTSQIQIEGNQSNLTQEDQFVKKRRLKKIIIKSTQYNNPLKSDFHLINSLQLDESKIKHHRTKTHFSSCKGYVNMLTQTSRYRVQKANSSYELSSFNPECDSGYSSHNLKKIHKFSSYISRKQNKSKPMPEYTNINYYSIKPNLKIGHIKFASFLGRKVKTYSNEINSLSFLNTEALSPKCSTTSQDFKKMSGRKQSLFPQAYPNIKKKGDSSIMRILKQASERNKKIIDI